MSLPPLTFATDTELRDAAFAEKLRRRRRLMLRWSLPVVILAGLLALKFLTAVGLNLVGTSAYDRANFSTAASRYTNTQFLNIVQPWKAYFNEGTADYSAGRFFTATQSFDIALDKVPKNPQDQPRGVDECAVRVNYSLAYEGIADETFAVGDAAMAENYYTSALEMLADCADSGEGGETAEDAQERQEESQQQTRDEQDDTGDPSEDPDPDDGDPDTGDPESADPDGSDPDEGNGDDDSPEPSPSPDSNQEELEERNQRANETDDPSDEQEGTGDGSGQNW